MNDIKGNPLILYATNGFLYIPHCTYISEIDVISNTSNCYKDVPITFSYHNKTWNAFLQKEKIIKRNSKLTYCQTINTILTVGNNFEIHRNGSSNSLQTQSILHYERINFFKIQTQNLNFHHLHELIEGIDVLDESNKYIQVVEDSGNYVISSDTFKSAENFVVKPVHSLVDAAHALATNTKKQIKHLIHIIFTIILSLTLIIVFLVILYFRRSIFTWLHQIYNRNQTALADVELNEKIHVDPSDLIFPDLQALQHSVHLQPPIYSDADDYNVPESTKKLARQIIKQLPPLKTTQLEDELPSFPEGPVKP
jgi:hypothetical protein